MEQRHGNSDGYRTIENAINAWNRRAERRYSQSRPIRNADIIRAMTDEELADFIAKQRLCTLNAIADIYGIDLTPALFSVCKKNMLDWLKQEAKRSELTDAESEIDKWWERSETVNAERSEDGKDKI